MNLSDIKEHQKVKVKNIYCPNELKQRFYSFGIINGAILEIEHISFSKNTIEVIVEDTSIALRLEEAKAIEVEVLR
jgi:Fe2+ transport system protein FeoA